MTFHEIYVKGVITGLSHSSASTNLPTLPRSLSLLLSLKYPEFSQVHCCGKASADLPESFLASLFPGYWGLFLAQYVFNFLPSIYKIVISLINNADDHELLVDILEWSMKETLS